MTGIEHGGRGGLRPTPSTARTDRPRSSSGELYGRYVLPEVEVLLRVASAMTPQRCDAEDLVQETLIRAWRSIDRFDGRHPRAWLLTIMRNASANLHRRHRPHLLDDPDAPPATDRERTAPSPESVVMSQTLDAALEKALADLPQPFRAAVALVDVAGLTYAQAAAVLDVPRGTVMSRLHRARARMRSQLEQAGVKVLQGEA